MSRSFPYLMLLVALAITITGMVTIGELLLWSRAMAGDNIFVPVGVALALTIFFGALGGFLSYRASKLPPVSLPGPVEPRQPVRQFDLGAGYLIGQFVLIVGVMLLLLFIILAVR